MIPHFYLSLHLTLQTKMSILSWGSHPLGSRDNPLLGICLLGYLIHSPPVRGWGGECPATGYPSLQDCQMLPHGFVALSSSPGSKLWRCSLDVMNSHQLMLSITHQINTSEGIPQANVSHCKNLPHLLPPQFSTQNIQGNELVQIISPSQKYI